MYLYHILHLMKLHASTCRQLLLTLQVHKVDKIVSRYCNKDIKVISIEALLVTLYRLWKWFFTVRKDWKPPSRKTYHNLRNLQIKYLWRSFVIFKPFFCSSRSFYLWFLSLSSRETLFGNITFRIRSNNCGGDFLLKWSTC